MHGYGGRWQWPVFCGCSMHSGSSYGEGHARAAELRRQRTFGLLTWARGSTSCASGKHLNTARQAGKLAKMRTIIRPGVAVCWAECRPNRALRMAVLVPVSFPHRWAEHWDQYGYSQGPIGKSLVECIKNNTTKGTKTHTIIRAGVAGCRAQCRPNRDSRTAVLVLSLIHI